MQNSKEYVFLVEQMLHHHSNHISTFIITYYLIYLQPIIAHMDFACINLDPPSTLVKEEKPPELASVRKDHKIQDCRFRV